MKHSLVICALSALMVSPPALAQPAKPATPSATGNAVPLQNNEGPAKPPQDPPAANAITTPSGQEFRASRLFAATVLSARNERIGTVSEFIFNGEGKILYVVVGVGGFLGVFGKRVALRLDKLKLEPEVENNIRITSSYTRGQLMAMPTWIARKWLDEKGSGPPKPPEPKKQPRGRF